jgi:high-affinity iron transporter
MLTWHNVWMARHGREIAAEMRAVGAAVVSGSRSAVGLTIVVAVAVLREGVEVVLFLYGVVLSAGEAGAEIFAGGIVGLLLGASVSAVTYLGLLTIPNRYLFSETGTLIAFLAAGMAAQATALLQQANFLTMLGETVWDSSSILSEKSIAGRVLHTLIGYSDRPTLLQLVVYLAVLAAIFVLMKLYGARPAHRAPARHSQIALP